MKTTLYNHNSLGTSEKPLIPNLEFKKAMERARKGEDVSEIIAKYSLESTQARLLKDAKPTRMQKLEDIFHEMNEMEFQSLQND